MHIKTEISIREFENCQSCEVRKLTILIYTYTYVYRLKRNNALKNIEKFVMVLTGTSYIL